MDSKTYWKNREDANLASNLKTEKEYEKELQRIYSDMLADCTKEIEAFYGRYADKEGITIAEAKKRVSELDIKEYERKAKRYVKDKDFSDQANEEMRIYNLTMKVNRLEMLKANIGLELIKGHDELEKFMGKILKGRTEEELKRQAGILGKTIRNNAKLADSIVNASFHNATFSQRIWMHQDLLKADLGKLLESGMIQGKGSRVLAAELRKQFGVKTSDAERLMRTELARVQTAAQKKSFEENGFKEYSFIVNSGCCSECAAIAKKNNGHYKVKDMMPGLNAPPMHPYCRCSVAAYEDSKDYEAWLKYLENGGTTKDWNKMTKAEKMAWLRKQQAKELKKQRQQTPEIRELPEIEFDEKLHGIFEAPATAKLEKLDHGEYKVTFAKRITLDWDSLTQKTQAFVRWFAPQRYEREVFLDKGEYGTLPLVKGSPERAKREEIAGKLGAEYIGTSWFRKYNALWELDVYEKDGKIFCSLGEAENKKTLKKKSLENVIKVAEDREKIIGEKLQEKKIRFSQLKARRGDDWVAAMKEFHRIIAADGKPTVLSDAEYDAIPGPTLYRGIAPTSHLRRDITNTQTPQQMADGFFTDDMPFPSRGIYGDGIAYCSPSLERIGAQYATGNYTINSGGKIIEYKIKPDAKTISYDEAVGLFEILAEETNSNLLFNKQQRSSDKEVGKAMNALGYDAIIKENGDNTGIPFYVILNRECLVTKENWTTVTVSPEWLRKVGRR